MFVHETYEQRKGTMSNLRKNVANKTKIKNEFFLQKKNIIFLELYGMEEIHFVCKSEKLQRTTRSGSMWHGPAWRGAPRHHKKPRFREINFFDSQ